MNRRPATALDSDDSGSDWDTTVAESPTHPEPRSSTIAAAVNNIDGDYATVTSKPRSSFKEDRGSKGTKRKSPSSTPRRDNPPSNMTSPPPHLTSFQNALTGDYATVQEVGPDIPPRGYEGKGKLYTVPETDSMVSPQTNIVNWDDSDAEERVLKELQQNVEHEKQRQQQLVASRDRKVTLAGGHSVAMDRVGMAADNQGYANSPTSSMSNESGGEKWNRVTKQGRSPQSGKGSDRLSDGHQKSIMPVDISHPSYFRSSGQEGRTTPSMMIKDPSGKRSILYFEEGSPHFVEIDEEKDDTFLPEKADKMEKIFRQVWREVFAALRIFTSIFVLFVTELVIFLTHHIVRPLVLDTIKTVGNFIVKPLLTILFNTIIQPVFSFLWNVFNSIYQTMEPVIRFLGSLFTKIAIVVRAFRLFTIQYHGQPDYKAEMEVV